MSTCPEESLVGIPAFLHAQSAQRELAAPLVMIVGGLLPKLFQDTRCSGTVFSYIIRHGLHLAPSVFAPELTSALTKLPSDCSFIPT